jgi:hypothetical protein
MVTAQSRLQIGDREARIWEGEAQIWEGEAPAEPRSTLKVGGISGSAGASPSQCAQFSQCVGESRVKLARGAGFRTVFNSALIACGSSIRRQPVNTPQLRHLE